MPDLTEKEITHFKRMYKHYYGKYLTTTQAKVKIHALVDLLRLVLEYERDHPEETP